VNFTVDIRAMDDQVRETIVTSFSRLALQRCDDRLVDCRVEHKVSRSAEPGTRREWLSTNRSS
jgi:allantoate deiminase